MNEKKTLFLASTSASRSWLLQSANIPFVLVNQHANEEVSLDERTVQEVVLAVADQKIEQVFLPKGTVSGEMAFVLVADTLTQARDGLIYAKPENRDHAVSMLRAVRSGAMVATAFIIDRRRWHDGEWQLSERQRHVVASDLVFNVPDEHIDVYLANSIGMKTSGAIVVEGYGARYTCSVNGSYTTIMGLPLYEVRQVLKDMGFSPI